jgi:hypothetical protein
MKYGISATLGSLTASMFILRDEMFVKAGAVLLAVLVSVAIANWLFNRAAK